MTQPPASDAPPRLVLDFSEPMRPKPRGRVKIIPAPSPSPSSDIFAYPNRRKSGET